MYPDLDEAIYTALKSSTLPALKRVKVFYYGQQGARPTHPSIDIAHAGDEMDRTSLDGDNRIQRYSIFCYVKGQDYLITRRELMQITQAVKEALKSDLDEGYSGGMKVEKVTPDYDIYDGHLAGAEVLVSFEFIEDFTAEDDEYGTVTFDDITINDSEWQEDEDEEYTLDDIDP